MQANTLDEEAVQLLAFARKFPRDGCKVKGTQFNVN
jgi:hypothetical protein